MSMKFHDVPAGLLTTVGVRKAEIAGFAQLKDADEVAKELRSLIVVNPDYQVITVAAGMYYVILIHPDFVEDTDVANTNS